MTKDINSKEGKEVKLRCVIKRNNSDYVGVCLELSLAVKAATPEACRDELVQTIEDYVDTLFLLKKEHGKVGIRSVEFYLFKKVLFDVRYYLHSLREKDDLEIGFVTKTVVPVAA